MGVRFLSPAHGKYNMEKYYDYREWKKACNKQEYSVGGAYSLAGNKKIRHRYAYDKSGGIVGEFVLDKRGSWGYLN